MTTFPVIFIQLNTYGQTVHYSVKTAWTSKAKSVLDLPHSICLPLWTKTLTIPWQQKETTRQKWHELHTSLQTIKINLVHIWRCQIAKGWHLWKVLTDQTPWDNNSHSAHQLHIHAITMLQPPVLYTAYIYY